MSLHGFVLGTGKDEGTSSLHSVKSIIFDQLYCTRNKIRPEILIDEE